MVSPPSHYLSVAQSQAMRMQEPSPQYLHPQFLRGRISRFVPQVSFDSTVPFYDRVGEISLHALHDETLLANQSRVYLLRSSSQLDQIVLVISKKCVPPDMRAFNIRKQAMPSGEALRLSLIEYQGMTYVHIVNKWIHETIQDYWVKNRESLDKATFSLYEVYRLCPVVVLCRAIEEAWSCTPVQITEALQTQLGNIENTPSPEDILHLKEQVLAHPAFDPYIKNQKDAFSALQEEEIGTYLIRRKDDDYVLSYVNPHRKVSELYFSAAGNRGVLCRGAFYEHFIDNTGRDAETMSGLLNTFAGLGVIVNHYRPALMNFIQEMKS